MSEGAPSMRPLAEDDAALLERATLGNVNWPGPRFTARDVRERPDLARYTRLIPGRGDLGVVAEEGAETVGVAWLCVFSADDPGYGFVAPGVPELSIWVSAAHRRWGLGTTLLRAVHGRARTRGMTRISLSVETGNPARRLYVREGYVVVPGAAAGVMLRELSP